MASTPPTNAGEAQPPAMLLDELVPQFEATRIEHRVIDGDQASVYAAVLQADFARAWSDNPAVKVLFAARSSAERVVSRALGREFTTPEFPESLRLADMPTHGQWVKLGESAPHEVVFGAVGRFWSGQTSWEEIDATQFKDFDRPGYAKIGCNFSLRPYGRERTLVSYEARTRATDDASRRAFGRYWKAASTGAGVVMRSQLAVVEREAARRRP